MKTAIYVEDGIIQLVITPTMEFEKNTLSIFEDKPLNVEIFTGGFYDCRGGWIKQNAFFPDAYERSDKSIILKISKEKVGDSDNSG